MMTVRSFAGDFISPAVDCSPAVPCETMLAHGLVAGLPFSISGSVLVSIPDFVSVFALVPVSVLVFVPVSVSVFVSDFALVSVRFFVPIFVFSILAMGLFSYAQNA